MVVVVLVVVDLAASFDLIVGVVTEPLFVFAVQSCESGFSSLVLTFLQVDSSTNKDIFLVDAGGINFNFHLTSLRGPFNSLFAILSSLLTLLHLTPVKIKSEFTATDIGRFNAGVYFSFSFNVGLVIESGISIDFPVVLQNGEESVKRVLVVCSH